MDGEAQAPKGGRHVGGFLQLFDWNGKSRKKLFSSKSDVPEYPKQGKKSKGNFPTTRIRVLDKDEIEATTSYKGGSDYSCASSVTDEEGFGSKAPGVVARLMGLDSLPTSHAIEPYISPFFDTQSLDEAPFRRRGKFLDEAEGMRRRNTMEPKHPKSLSSAIEKFQTESLPPKSAKSIPITQHKLLSPIKNPCFVPSNDPAGIMEAATKIIDARPQAASSTARTRISSAGSSSVPLKTRELKEKVAASQRPFKVSSCSAGDSSASTKNKGKSVNLAIQAKVNVQRREGLNPRRDSMEGRQEDDASGSTRSNKIAHKKPSARSTASTVLRQNNRKQNCTVENAPSSKKLILGDSSHGRQRNSYKGGSKKSGLEGRDGHTHRDVSSHSGARSVPRKKRIIDGNLQDVRNDSSDSMMISQSYSATERRFPRVEDGREDGADIVSFTFTTPMTRSMGDPLSVLLEQKLRELTNGIGPSKCNFIQGEASCRQNSSAFFARSKTGRQHDLHMDSMHDRMLSSLSSTEAEVPRQRYDLEGGEMDECSSTKLQTRQLHNRRYPSPVSILDSSDLNESCNSSDSTESNTTEECKEVYDSSSCSKLSTEWELDYIKDVLSNVELMFKDCASGRTHDIINPHLFDQLERKRGSSSSYKGTVLVEKKALFDCVSECLGWRCQRFVGGGFKAWEKGLAVMRRKEKLVEEVYIEIKGWRSMMSCMVDEIVDKDMSIPHGRWLDFEADGFGIAVDVETRIFDDLVGEVVADVLAGGGFKGYGAFL